MEQHTRDLVTGELTLDYFVRRAAEGWKISAVEWVRETERGLGEEHAQTTIAPVHEAAALPYGLQIAEGGRQLENNPLETTVLLLILDQIVREKRLTEIADQLNVSGYKTREGHAWSPSAVFNLMPRLIEAGPSLLKSAAWEQRRTGAHKPQ